MSSIDSPLHRKILVWVLAIIYVAFFIADMLFGSAPPKDDHMPVYSIYCDSILREGGPEPHLLEATKETRSAQIPNAYWCPVCKAYRAAVEVPVRQVRVNGKMEWVRDWPAKTEGTPP